MTQPALGRVSKNAWFAPPGEDQTIGLSSAGLALLCSILWGGIVVAIRFSVDDLPPVGVAGMRFALAALCMLAWCAWQGSPLRIRSGQLNADLSGRDAALCADISSQRRYSMD